MLLAAGVVEIVPLKRLAPRLQHCLQLPFGQRDRDRIFWHKRQPHAGYCRIGAGRVLVQKRLYSTSPFSCNCVERALTRSELTYKNPLYYLSFKIILNTVSPYVITRDLCIITIYNNIFFWLVRKIRRYFFFRRI